jgi:hypothetical protein
MSDDSKVIRRHRKAAYAEAATLWLAIGMIVGAALARWWK